jgi:hypothetical protein
MTRLHISNTFSLVLALWLLGVSGLTACSDAHERAPRPTKAEQRPLQPLIYTERPDLSVEAAAVRERRLMRQLLEGSSASGNWGDLEAVSETKRPTLTDADQLGEAMFDALVERDEGLWDALFVAPADYAGMVHLDLDKSREFVDDVQAKSRETWESFEPGRASEAREDGLEGLLEFASLELGEGRTVGGSVAEDDEPVAQHWGNVLELRLSGTDVHFELRISKILYVAHPRHRPNQPMLGLASAVQMSSQLEVYLRAGLHLKPELLETREYPYPLAVGNFWRYRRSPADGPADEADGSASKPADSEELDAENAAYSGLTATETLLEVTSVDRHGSWRLVTLRRSYNDENLTTYNQHWLVLPRRIYRCSSVCRTHSDDLGWLLSYLDQQTPIFRFPMNLEDGWGEGGQSADASAVFEVGADWSDVDVPAGNYANTVAIEGTGPLALIDGFYRGREQTRYFAHGRGVVRRVLGSRADGSRGRVVERLVESRIMPR